MNQNPINLKHLLSYFKSLLDLDFELFLLILVLFDTILKSFYCEDQIVWHFRNPMPFNRFFRFLIAAITSKVIHSFLIKWSLYHGLNFFLIFFAIEHQIYEFLFLRSFCMALRTFNLNSHLAFKKVIEVALIQQFKKASSILGWVLLVGIFELGRPCILKRSRINCWPLSSWQKSKQSLKLSNWSDSFPCYGINLNFFVSLKLFMKFLQNLFFQL